MTTEVYNDTIETLKEKKTVIEIELKKTKENLSNLEKYIEKTLLISCNTMDLWERSNFDI